jgi:hypothetical protein
MNVTSVRRTLAEALNDETVSMSKAVGATRDFISGRITALRFALDLLEDDEKGVERVDTLGGR